MDDLHSNELHTNNPHTVHPRTGESLMGDSPVDGFALIDKPAGCTSHDVVNRWRKIAGTKRVGHLGTLDPMATGLLVVMTGKATRLAQFYGTNAKTYCAEITFGLVSDTYDVEGDVTLTGSPTPSREAVLSALEKFRGRFQQLPPPVSAKKIKGVPAYKLARKQLPVELKPVEVEVRQLGVVGFEVNKLQITVACSAGTYIRSIAHDLGVELGCGAVLSSLRRTHSGEFSVESARTLDALTALAKSRRLPEAIIPAGQLLPHFPASYYDVVAESRIRQGRDFRTSPFVVSPAAPFVRALAHSGRLIAVGQLKIPNLYHPSVVL
jgi:tRNA pseudouridine55 synthase